MDADWQLSSAAKRIKTLSLGVTERDGKLAQGKEFASRHTAQIDALKTVTACNTFESANTTVTVLMRGSCSHVLRRHIRQRVLL